MPVIDEEKLKQALATLAGRTAEQFAEGVGTGASALRALSELAAGKPATGGLAPFLEQLPERTARAFGLTPYGEASEREKAIANLISFLPEILAAGGGAAALGMAKMRGGSLPLGKPQSWIQFRDRVASNEIIGRVFPPPEYQKWAERLKKEGLIHFTSRQYAHQNPFTHPQEYLRGVGYRRQEAEPLSSFYINALGQKLLTHPTTPVSPPATSTQLKEILDVSQLAASHDNPFPSWMQERKEEIIDFSRRVRDALARKEVKAFYYWLGEDVGKAMDIVHRIADGIAKEAPAWAIAEEQKRLSQLLGVKRSSNFGATVLKKLQDILQDRFYDVTVLKRHTRVFTPVEPEFQRPPGMQHIAYSALPGLSEEASQVLGNYYESIGRNKAEPLQVIENLYLVRRKDLARWAAKRPGPTRASLSLLAATDIWAREPYTVLSRIPYAPSAPEAIKSTREGVIPRRIDELFPPTPIPHHYDRVTPEDSVQIAFSESHPSAALIVRPVNEWPIPQEEAAEFFAKWQHPDKVNLLSQEGKMPFFAVTEVQSDIDQNPESRRRLIVGQKKLMEDSAEFWRRVEKVNQAWDRFFTTVESLPDSGPILSMFEGSPFALSNIKNNPVGFMGTLMFYTSGAAEPDFYRRGTQITVHDLTTAIMEAFLSKEAWPTVSAGERLLDIFRRIQVPKSELLTYFGEPTTIEIAPDLEATVKAIILSLFQVGMDEHPLEGYIRLINTIAQKAFGPERQKIASVVGDKLEDLRWQGVWLPQPESVYLRGWAEGVIGQMELILNRARQMMALTPSNYEKARELEPMMLEARELLRELHDTAKKVFNAEYRPWGLDYRDFVIRHAFITAFKMGFEHVGFASGSTPARRWVSRTQPFGSEIIVNGRLESEVRRYNLKVNGEMSTASRTVLKRAMPRVESGEADFPFVLNDFRDFVSVGHPAVAYDVLYDNLLLDRIRAILRYYPNPLPVIQGAIGITNIGRAMREGGYYLIPVSELFETMRYASVNDNVIEEPTAVA